VAKPAQHTGIALAVGAHPDDIEFLMAGTLLLLRRAGYETHYLNLASGSCGGSDHSATELRVIRRQEAKSAAKLLGCIYHPHLVDDLCIYYEPGLVRRVGAIVREVGPTVMLVPSPQDYMEDHTNTCRLAVTAAFVRGMRNFATRPPRRPVGGEVTLYHAMPHGLRDTMRRRVIPGSFANTSSVQGLKRLALAEHRSQQTWLASSQKMNAYLGTMESFAREVGDLSGRFRFAEGWRRHLHYGFCAVDDDPLREALGKDYLVNLGYEAELEGGRVHAG
jgi:N-acetylglucosamine malate deacetylase 1